MSQEFLTGTSGYFYKGWWQFQHPISKNRDQTLGYYPENIAKGRALEYYSKDFTICELNSPFYKLPSVGTVKKWYGQTPENFKFLVKFSRFATHGKKLADFEENYRNFWDDRLEHLKEKCVGILVQLGPKFKNAGTRSKVDSLTMFERIRKAGRVKTAVKIFVEFRDPSWFCSEVYSLLKEIGWVPVHVNLNNFGREFGNMDSGYSPKLDEDELQTEYFMARCHGTWSKAYRGGYSLGDLQELYFKAKKYQKAIIIFDNTDTFAGMVECPVPGKMMFDGNFLGGASFPHAVSDAQTMQTIHLLLSSETL